MGRQVQAQERCWPAVVELPRGQVPLLLLLPGWGRDHHHQHQAHPRCPRDLLEEGNPGGKQVDWPCSVEHCELQSHPMDQEWWTERQCFHPKGHHCLHCHLPALRDSMDQGSLLFAAEGLGPDKSQVSNRSTMSNLVLVGVGHESWPMIVPGQAHLPRS